MAMVRVRRMNYCISHENLYAKMSCSWCTYMIDDWMANSYREDLTLVQKQTDKTQRKVCIIQ